MSLRDAVVVVTGATGAAGPPVIERLVDAGATVVAVGRDRASLDALAGERVVPAVVDLLDAEATEAFGRQLLAEHGRVDGLVHLVGGWRGGKGIVEADLADYRWLHDNLVVTLQHATRALHDPIAASPIGRVVIVSTTALDRPTAGNAFYLTAKAGAEAWMQALAHSFRETEAAAVVLRIKALLTPQMREDKPEAKFTGYTPVALLADVVVDQFEEPAAQINGGTFSALPG
ncbi:short subunit dehydrogenase [Barrientosiimonas humi]|uniref:Short subunit dehydrogenase n=2 Tax=Barrientosiimonas TaxID=1535207 RepID=A0A542XEW1_9MICO|nr:MULTISPECIES: SDR family oxidoreductase [Barrientosiimonas]TQL34367.1 short subunit dehydrogenase [Barrientosiimonas humi]BDZ59439.1 oxidoreductase [Barrientosiimonas endolithica]CAG7574358.1 putative oxidoreductase [Barrientosiimonas humi]